MRILWAVALGVILAAGCGRKPTEIDNARELVKNGQYDLAVEAAAEYALKNPTDGRSVYELSLMMENCVECPHDQRNQVLGLAVAMLRERVKRNPRNAAALVDLGAALQDAGDFDASRAAFRSAVSVDSRVRWRVIQTEMTFALEAMAAVGSMDSSVMSSALAEVLEWDDSPEGRRTIADTLLGFARANWILLAGSGRDQMSRRCVPLDVVLLDAILRIHPAYSQEVSRLCMTSDVVDSLLLRFLTPEDRQKLSKSAYTDADDNDIPVIPFWKVEVKPQPVEIVKPDYPEAESSGGIEGTVVVKALVDVDSSIADACVLKTSGNESLDRAAVAAARKARFTPAQQRDRPVRVWVSIPYRFALH